MNLSRRRFLLLASAAFLGSGWSHGTGWTQTPIPLFPVTGQFDNITAVSNDGTIFAGFARRGSPQKAYTYTEAGGFVQLPLLGTGTFAAVAGCSSDASVIVGYADPGTTSGFQHAVRWSGGVVADLTAAITNPGYSQAFWCSSDGSFVVGYQTTDGSVFRGFTWTSGGGIVLLALLAGGSNNGAQFCSDNGNVVGGFADVAGGSYVPCYWTGGGAAVQITTPDAASSFGTVTGGSSDGSVLVGTYTRTSDGQTRGFRWTAAGGAVDMGTAPGSRVNVQPRACSGDGSIVTGVADTVGGNTSPVAFVWDAINGFTIIGGPKADAVCIAKNGRTVGGDKFDTGMIWRKQ